MKTIPIQIVSSQNVKIILKNSLHTQNEIDSNFIFIKSGDDHEICNNNNILGFCGHLPRDGMMAKEKKTRRNIQTPRVLTAATAAAAARESAGSIRTVYLINSLASGFNLWSLRHTVALVLILIEDITFHYTNDVEKSVYIVFRILNK